MTWLKLLHYKSIMFIMFIFVMKYAISGSYSIMFYFHHMSLAVRKPVFEVSDQVDINWAVQPPKMSTGMKFHI